MEIKRFGWRGRRDSRGASPHLSVVTPVEPPVRAAHEAGCLDLLSDVTKTGVWPKGEQPYREGGTDWGFPGLLYSRPFSCISFSAKMK